MQTTSAPTEKGDEKMADVRLIDADKYPCQTCNVSHCYQNCEKFVEWFNNTVDAVPVVHGRWDDECRCTACGWYGDDIYKRLALSFDYCPNCGAKMDLEVKNYG
jgi:hypothetical protein